MSKKDTYRCTECGAVSSGWTGRCFVCKSWSSVVAEVQTTDVVSNNAKPVEVEYICDEKGFAEVSHLKTGVPELDRLLGGGVVPGSVILIGGEPGVGKSTLMMHVAAGMSEYGTCLYVSGEESSEQVRLRAKRLGVNQTNIGLVFSTSLESVMTAIRSVPNLKVIIVDSIQTMCSQSCPSVAGTIAQVRFCAQELASYAKNNGIPIFILGQITKDGQIAGPKMLEHMVDVVLYFEGDTRNGCLLLRGMKNRFGASNEVGIFEMRGSGLFSVENPSLLFTDQFSSGSHGSVIFAGIEGSRPLLMEVQTLVSKTTIPTPRRAVVGWDINRLAMVIAVLSARCGIFLHDKEVYLNVAGGFKIQDTAADLAVAASLMSSMLEIPIPDSTVVFGEIALSGDVKGVTRTESRIKESCRMGFGRVILPELGESNLSGLNSVKIRHVRNLRGVFGL